MGWRLDVDGSKKGDCMGFCYALLDFGKNDDEIVVHAVRLLADANEEK